MTTLDADMRRNRDAFDALVQGRHSDPFAVLGVHRAGGSRFVRTFQPQAKSVLLIDRDGNALTEMAQVHADGFFTAIMPPRKRRYRFRVTTFDDVSSDIEDPYRFPSSLGELDLYLLGEGSDLKIYNKLGAQVRTLDRVRGTRFAVWAPNASRISVIGDFNDWDPKATPMNRLKNGEFKVTLDLETGRDYSFRYLIEGRNWENDWAADGYIPSGIEGAENSVVTV